MRALLGGIVGAAASAAAWLGIEHFQQTHYGWLVVLVGLVTGISVNKAGAGTTAGFARGALAMVLALAGIVGGQKGYAAYMQATTSAAAVAPAASIDLDDGTEEPAEDESDTDEAPKATETAPLLDAAQVDLNSHSYSKSAMKKNLSEWDTIWMCIAALAAYITGKGSGGAVSETTDEQDADGSTPSDESAGDAE